MGILLRDGMVKTRKPHRCWGCARPFPAGSELQSTTAVFDNAIATTYWCEVCFEYMRGRPAGDFDDGISEGELKDCDPEGWADVKRRRDANNS